MNRLLLSEKKNFMAKLNISRFLRTKVENDAAVKLQSVYRGHYTRISMLDIEQNSLVNRKIRSNIRSYLANRFKMKLSLASYRLTRVVIRNKSAALIQCLFMRYLSRKCLRRRRHEHRLARRLWGAIAIQAVVRGASARARVKLLVERIRMVVATKSALRVQTVYRGMLARRKVCRRRIKLRLLASRAIQNWFRAKYSRQMAAHIKQMMYIKNSNHGALLMQGAVRQFVARRRVDRIRLRRLHKVVFKCVTAIQTLVRKFLGKITVKKRRELFVLSQAEIVTQAARSLAKDEEARIEIETKTLLESVDLFLQARAGRTSEVEDIFKGLVSTDSHTNTDVDPTSGDTLLTIAATVGNTDLLRKCLLWGFEINHRNDEGLSALLLAVKHNHYPAMQYLLTPPVAAEGETVGISAMLDPFSADDMGYLIVTATANAGAAGDLGMLTALLEIEGMDVNAKQVSTGQTALHAACETGNLDAFRLLMKYKASLDVTDEQGQGVLHKASGSSLKIAQLILGLDPSFNTYMSEMARTVSILAVDGDGKDCVLLAALAGQTELLDLYDSIVKASVSAGSRPVSKSGKKPSFSALSGTGSFKLSSAEDIGWTPNDVVRALRLVEGANLLCVQRIMQIGFDPNWPEEGTGTTMAIAACRCGDVDMADLLMVAGADFAAADDQGRTAMHFASVCNGAASARDDTHASSVVVHLLTHNNATACNMSAKALAVSDAKGETPLHWAAREGVCLEVDLLARSSIFEALSIRNAEGMTPLLLACSHARDKLIHAYIRLGADVHAVDAQERGCLWHLFHPHASTLQGDGRKRPFCSEFCAQSSIPSVAKAYGASARKDKDDDVARLTSDITTLQLMLKAGCSLYSSHLQSPEDMLQLRHSLEEAPSAVLQMALHPGDILVQELSLAAIKVLLQASALSALDAWRLRK
jgi:ankyrin repeat protein